MFARTATVLTHECRRVVRALVGQTFRNIQELDRLDAMPRRRAPALTCRWQLDPTSGRPICIWEVESPGLSPDLAPTPDLDPHRSLQAPERSQITASPHEAEPAST